MHNIISSKLPPRLFQRASASALRPATPFSIEYIDGGRLREILADKRLMAVIRHGSTTHRHTDDPRLLTIGLPEAEDHGTLEVWRSRSPVASGVQDDIRFFHNEAVLFGHLMVEETHYPNLDVATYSAYQKIVALIRTQRYPHLLRVWNYFPDIHREQQGLERYKAFCQGRHLIMEKHAGLDAILPAAGAFGTRSKGLLICFLSARQPPTPTVASQYISAFRQPRQQTIKTPPFSKAVLKQWSKTENHLYVSGTAGIVGHDALHSQDPCTQLRETLNDLEALVAEVRHQTRLPLAISLLKVYAREELCINTLRKLIEERLGAGVPTLFLRADICRSNLFLEIETLCSN